MVWSQIGQGKKTCVSLTPQPLLSCVCILFLIYHPPPCLCVYLKMPGFFFLFFFFGNVFLAALKCLTFYKKHSVNTFLLGFI